MPSMLPCLASLNSELQWSIVPQRHRQVLGLDLFGGSTHIRCTRWEINSKPGELEVYAIMHVEVHSAFIPKVWFGHLTLANLPFQTEPGITTDSRVQQKTPSWILAERCPSCSIGPPFVIQTCLLRPPSCGKGGCSLRGRRLPSFLTSNTHITRLCTTSGVR